MRLSTINGNWSGGFYDGSELYLLESAQAALPASRMQAGDENYLAVFRASDLTQEITIDKGGVPISHQKNYQKNFGDHDLLPSSDTLSNRSGDVTEDIPLTVVTDTEFKDEHGSDVAAVVASRVNFVDGVYAAQMGVGMSLFHLEILTNNGPLTSTDGVVLLNRFRTFVGDIEDIPFEGLAHLFTGKTIDQGSAGLAFFASLLCNTNGGYGWNRNLNSGSLSSMVVAHEIGHNLNGPHDGEENCSDEDFRGIMSATLTPNTPQEFSNCSVDEIVPSIAAGSSCLIPRAAYTVNTEVNGPGTIDPTSQTVEQDNTAELTLIPDTGGEIDDASGCDGSLTGATYTTGPISADCTITANFSSISYTVSTSVTGPGLIDPTSATVEHGSNTSFELIADTGGEIVSASGCDGSLSGTTYTTGSVTGACSVSVEFALMDYIVSTNVSGPGSISPTSAVVTHGDTTEFTFLPDGGAVIDSVIGCDGSLNGQTYTTGAITEACTVQATFSENIDEIFSDRFDQR